MTTPVCDFVRAYAEKEVVRLHMPGHKGHGMLGIEALDLTEVDGADSLYEASGVIRESEENAASLFGCPTFYSTEGSSQCIRAMLFLALLYGKENGKSPRVIAARNAHKTFLSALALLGMEADWLYPEGEGSYLACPVSPAALETALEAAEEPPCAVYITSPDYLGNVADVAALAEVCRRHGVLFLVDNAHGAYLKFLPESLHPIDLGADMCCDSAHKTLPVLTGGAYLHLSDALMQKFGAAQVKQALCLFGSTSPSYLILQSLDAANVRLADFSEELTAFIPSVENMKRRLAARGYVFAGGEPLKLTLDAKAYGYTGRTLAGLLSERGIVVEFSDPDFTVMMLAPVNGEEALQTLEAALSGIEKRPPLSEKPPVFFRPERALSVREAALSPAESVPAEESLGRVLAAASVGCPPAVPILACGEVVTENALSVFRYYGIETLSVVRSC